MLVAERMRLKRGNEKVLCLITALTERRMPALVERVSLQRVSKSSAMSIGVILDSQMERLTCREMDLLTAGSASGLVASLGDNPGLLNPGLLGYALSKRNSDKNSYACT